MNKTDLIKYVSDKTMITEADAGIIVDVFLDGIKKGLIDGERVKIRDFGSFVIQERKARTALSPYDQSVVDVPAKKVVKFIAANKVKEMVK